MSQMQAMAVFFDLNLPPTLSKQTAPIFFAHANGFPGGSYQPLFDAMKPLQVYFIDNISDNIEEVFPRLKPLVKKLEGEIRNRFDRPIIGIGHSLGGILMFFVAKKNPELFEQVIFLDPPFFRPSKRLLVGTVGKIGLGDVVPVAKLAANRREFFSSQEKAETYFKSKRLFKRAHPDTARHFVKHGLVPEEKKWRLRIPPAFERAVYLNLPITLGDKQLEIPSHFLYATGHDVLSARDLRWLKRNFSETEFIPIEGNHMFPLEAPEAVANEIRKCLVA